MMSAARESNEELVETNFEIHATSPVRVICSRHPKHMKSLICLETHCYQLFCFDVELCSVCYEKYHSSHRVVPLELFLTTVFSCSPEIQLISTSTSTSTSGNTITTTTNTPTTTPPPPISIATNSAFPCINEIAEAFSATTASINPELRNLLFNRVNEFKRDYEHQFTLIRARCMKAQTRSPKKRRLFPTRTGFHQALDRFFNGTKYATQPNTHNCSKPNESLNAPAAHIEYHQRQINQQNQYPSILCTFKLHMNFAVHFSLFQSYLLTKNSLLPQPQSSQDHHSSTSIAPASLLPEHEKNNNNNQIAIQQNQSILPQKRNDYTDDLELPYPINAKPLSQIMNSLLQGQRATSDSQNRMMQAPTTSFDTFRGEIIALFNLQTNSLFFGAIFPVMSDFIGIQANQSIYYFSPTYRTLDLFYEAPILSISDFLVCDLNRQEFCVIIGQELRLLCKITGATLLKETLEKKNITLLRRINNNLIAYVSGYVIHLWDRREGGHLVQKIALNLLAIQEIIEVADDRLIICANDHYFYVYDHLIHKKILKRIDTRRDDWDTSNVNCNNIIFLKAAKRDILLSSYVGSPNIAVWNMRSGKKIRATSLVQDQILAVVAIPTSKGTHFAVAGFCGIYIYDAAGGNLFWKGSACMPMEIVQNPRSFYTRSLHVCNGELVSIASDTIRIFR